MSSSRICTRRLFLAHYGAAGAGWASAAGFGAWTGRLRAVEPVSDGSDVVRKITDAEIRAGVEAAIEKNLIAAAIAAAFVPAAHAEIELGSGFSVTGFLDMSYTNLDIDGAPGSMLFS